MLRIRQPLSTILLLSVILVLSLSILFSPIPISLLNSLFSTNRSVSLDYMAHDPISVTNDDELAAVANSGTGTVNDPYIISGWEITSNNTTGIFITATTKHFRIENCWMENCSVSIESVEPGTAIITDTIINVGSLHLHSADLSLITNNIIISER